MFSQVLDPLNSILIDALVALVPVALPQRVHPVPGTCGWLLAHVLAMTPGSAQDDRDGGARTGAHEDAPGARRTAMERRSRSGDAR